MKQIIFSYVALNICMMFLCSTNIQSQNSVILKPIILPYRPIQIVSNTNSLSNVQNTEQIKTSDPNKLPEIKTSDIKGLYGQRQVQLQIISANEVALTQLIRETSKEIMDSKNQTERDMALSYYHKELAVIKNKVNNLLIRSNVYSNDEKLFYEDIKDLDSYGSESPALLIDFGSITANTQKDVDGLTIRTHKIFEYADNGIVASYRLNIFSKRDYLDNCEKSQLTDKNGMPERYIRYFKSATSDEYLNRIKSEVRTSIGTTLKSFIIVSDGNKFSLSRAQIQDVLNHGVRFCNSTTVLNNLKIKSAINTLFEKLSPKERNFALERLISSGANVPQKQNGGQVELESSTYGDLALKISSTKAKYNRSSSVYERNSLMQEGLALSTELINGVKNQVFIDAIRLTQ